MTESDKEHSHQDDNDISAFSVVVNHDPVPPEETVSSSAAPAEPPKTFKNFMDSDIPVVLAKVQTPKEELLDPNKKFFDDTYRRVQKKVMSHTDFVIRKNKGKPGPSKPRKKREKLDHSYFNGFFVAYLTKRSKRKLPDGMCLNAPFIVWNEAAGGRVLMGFRRSFKDKKPIYVVPRSLNEAKSLARRMLVHENPSKRDWAIRQINARTGFLDFCNFRNPIEMYDTLRLRKEQVEFLLETRCWKRLSPLLDSHGPPRPCDQPFPVRILKRRTKRGEKLKDLQEFLNEKIEDALTEFGDDENDGEVAKNTNEEFLKEGFRNHFQDSVKKTSMVNSKCIVLCPGCNCGVSRYAANNPYRYIRSPKTKKLICDQEHHEFWPATFKDNPETLQEIENGIKPEDKVIRLSKTCQLVVEPCIQCICVRCKKLIEPDDHYVLCGYSGGYMERRLHAQCWQHDIKTLKSNPQTKETGKILKELGRNAAHLKCGDITKKFYHDTEDWYTPCNVCNLPYEAFSQDAIDKPVPDPGIQQEIDADEEQTVILRCLTCGKDFHNTCLADEMRKLVSVIKEPAKKDTLPMRHVFYFCSEDCKSKVVHYRGPSLLKRFREINKTKVARNLPLIKAPERKKKTSKKTKKISSETTANSSSSSSSSSVSSQKKSKEKTASSANKKNENVDVSYEADDEDSSYSMGPSTTDNENEEDGCGESISNPDNCDVEEQEEEEEEDEMDQETKKLTNTRRKQKEKKKQQQQQVDQDQVPRKSVPSSVSSPNKRSIKDHRALKRPKVFTSDNPVPTVLPNAPVNSESESSSQFDEKKVDIRSMSARDQQFVILMDMMQRHIHGLDSQLKNIKRLVLRPYIMKGPGDSNTGGVDFRVDPSLYESGFVSEAGPYDLFPRTNDYLFHNYHQQSNSSSFHPVNVMNTEYPAGAFDFTGATAQTILLQDLTSPTTSENNTNNNTNGSFSPTSIPTMAAPDSTEYHENQKANTELYNQSIPPFLK